MDHRDADDSAEEEEKEEAVVCSLPFLTIAPDFSDRSLRRSIEQIAVLNAPQHLAAISRFGRRK
jgi:hypothetical protein